MLISFPIIVLGSHLVIRVADNVPKFDIARGCRLDNAASLGLVEVQPLKNASVMSSKRVSSARRNGLNFPSRTREPALRTQTVMTPSYVKLLTCLVKARGIRGQSKK